MKESIIQKRSFWVHLIHIFVFGTLFLYIGIQRTNIPTFLFPALMGLAVIILLYHGYKLWTSASPSWVYYIHILLVAPLLFYIGFTGKETSRKYFEFVLLLGFAAIGYHAYYLLHHFSFNI